MSSKTSATCSSNSKSPGRHSGVANNLSPRGSVMLCAPISAHNRLSLRRCGHIRSQQDPSASADLVATAHPPLFGVHELTNDLHALACHAIQEFFSIEKPAQVFGEVA